MCLNIWIEPADPIGFGYCIHCKAWAKGKEDHNGNG